jgi:hypothetical protein
MLRQGISAASRGLGATARLSTQRQAFRLTQPFQKPVAATRPVILRTRWYSSEADATRKEGEASQNNGTEAEKANAAEEGKKEGETDPLETLKKQLEQKEAEVRDLKVKSFATITTRSLAPLLIPVFPGPVSPFHCRLPQPAGTDTARNEGCARLCDSELRQGLGRVG